MDRAQALARDFRMLADPGLTVSDWAPALRPGDQRDIAGLNGEMPPFRVDTRPGNLCYDLSYAMQDTPFVAWAR